LLRKPYKFCHPRRGFSNLASGCFWPIAEIVDAEIDAGFTSALEQEAEQRAHLFIQSLQGFSCTQIHFPKCTKNNFVSEKPIFHSQGMGPDGAAFGRPGVGFGVGESMRLILDFKNGVA
jgi:hypothetical protein